MVITSSGRSLSLAGGITSLTLLFLRGKGINLVLSVLLDEVGKVFDCPCAGIFNRRVFGTGREQLDGGNAVIGSGTSLAVASILAMVTLESTPASA